MWCAMASSFFNCRLLAALVLLSVILLPGCGDLPGSVGSILVSPPNITIGINQSQYFTGLGRNSGGFLVNTTPVWSVQGSIGMIKSSGFFQAGSVEAAGEVVATDGTLTGSAAVTITIKGWLKGNIKDSNGSIVNGIRVYLLEKPALGDETDTNGNYSIADIPAGTYRATIDPRPPDDGASQEVTIGQGQTVTWSPQLFTPSTTVTTTTLLSD